MNKWVKIGAGVVGVVVVVPLLLALVLPKDYGVSREIVISQPVPVVFSYIKHLKNQDNYSTWSMKDPDMQKSYRGEDGTVGFVAAWDSSHREVGKGEQEITAIVENERLDVALRFFEPFEGNDEAYMITTPVSDTETKVVWGFQGHMAYPMNLMLLVMDMEKLLGSELQIGLVNLKAVLEK